MKCLDNNVDLYGACIFQTATGSSPMAPVFLIVTGRLRSSSAAASAELYRVSYLPAGYIAGQILCLYL